MTTTSIPVRVVRRPMRQIVSLLVVAIAMVAVSPNHAVAEDWPSLEDYVDECVLIVKCKTERKVKFQYQVLETWKGKYSPDLFLFDDTPPEGCLFAHQNAGNDRPRNGREVIFFFTRRNQPVFAKGKFEHHSACFNIEDGKVIWAETSEFDAKEYTVDEFKRAITSIVKNQEKPKAASEKNVGAATDGQPADATMPDITGKWKVQYVDHEENVTEADEFWIRKRHDEDGFQFVNPGTKEVLPVIVRWLPDKQEFAWKILNHPAAISVKLQSDAKKMAVAFTWDERYRQAVNKADGNDSISSPVTNQIWTLKTSKIDDAEFDKLLAAASRNSKLGSDAKMPDISGKWRVKESGADDKKLGNERILFVTPVAESKSEFEFNAEGEGAQAARGHLQWNAKSQCFEGVIMTFDSLVLEYSGQMTLSIVADGQRGRVTYDVTKQQIDKSIDKVLTENDRKEEKIPAVRSSVKNAIETQTVPPIRNASAVWERVETNPATDAKMPDISGEWSMGKDGIYGDCVIRWDERNDGLLMKMKRKGKTIRESRCTWFPSEQCFKAQSVPLPGLEELKLRLQPDGKTMHVTFEVNELIKPNVLKENPDLTEAKLEELSNQVWTLEEADTHGAHTPKRIDHFETKYPLSRIACSADGKLIAIASGNPSLSRSDDRTGTIDGRWSPVIEVLLNPELTKAVTFTTIPFLSDADSKLIADTPRLSNVEATALAFSPNGKLLAVGTNVGQVKLFDVKTRELIRQFDDEAARLADKNTPESWKSLKRALGNVSSLAFSPDGLLLATSGGSFGDFSSASFGSNTRLPRAATGPGRLKVWDVESGAIKHDLAGHSSTDAVAFSPNGKLLASAGSWSSASGDGNGAILWKVATGEPVHTVAINDNGGTHAVAFSPDSNLLTIGSIAFEKDRNTSTGFVRLVRIGSGIVEWSQTAQGFTDPIEFAADGKMVPGFARPVAFAAGEKSVAVLCEAQLIRFLEAATGKHQLALCPATVARDGSLNDFALSQNGRLVAIGGADKQQKGFVEIIDLGEAAGNQKPTAVESEAALAKPMPDISGTWQKISNVVRFKSVIRRDEQTNAFFVRVNPGAKSTREFRFVWSETDQCFQATKDANPNMLEVKWELRLQPEDQSMRVTVSFAEGYKAELLKDRSERAAEIERHFDEKSNQVWMREDSFNQVPDLSGTWRAGNGGVLGGQSGKAVIRRDESEKEKVSFLMDVNPEGKTGREVQYVWDKWERCFKVSISLDGSTDVFGSQVQMKWKLQPQLDGTTMLLVPVKLDENSKAQLLKANPGLTAAKLEELSKQVWIREESERNVAASPGGSFGPDLPNPIVEESSPAIQKRDKSPPSKRVSVGLNSHEAQELREKLRIQEDAATIEAAVNRQLRVDGQVDQNNPAFAEHQGKLERLLHTAFDLKLKLEELQVSDHQRKLAELLSHAVELKLPLQERQVRDLQSRLSSAERQIAQRKELREKIVAQRAAELIEGEKLKWDAVQTAADQQHAIASEQTEVESMLPAHSNPPPSIPEAGRRAPQVVEWGPIVQFELRVRGEEQVETIYFNGVCVSEDGLVVIPVSAKSLVDDDPITVYEPYRGTACIEASDELHCLTLVKLRPPSIKPFSWYKCRSAMPGKGQRLTVVGVSPEPSHEVTVAAVERSYSAPLEGNDGFTIEPVHGALIGAPLVSLDNQLQGIVLQTSGFFSQVDSNFNIPAVHVQKLLDDDRRSVDASQQSTDATPSGEIVGYLKDETGKPIVGATVACGAVIDDTRKGGGSNAVTDAEGRYRLKTPSPGIYDVWLKKYDEPGFTAVADDGLLVEADRVTASEMTLILGVPIKGIVTHDGEPVSRAKVHCRSTALLTSSTAETMTNNKGEFTFTLPPGRSHFLVESQPFSTGFKLAARNSTTVARVDDELGAEPAAQPLVRLELQAFNPQFGSTDWLEQSTPGSQVLEQLAAADVTGTVVDSSGTPISGAKVFPTDGEITTTNEQGEFRVTVSKGTQFVLHAFQSGYHVWVGTPTAGDVLKIVMEEKSSGIQSDSQN